MINKNNSVCNYFIEIVYKIIFVKCTIKPNKNVQSVKFGSYKEIL